MFSWPSEGIILITLPWGRVCGFLKGVRGLFIGALRVRKGHTSCLSFGDPSLEPLCLRSCWPLQLVQVFRCSTCLCLLLADQLGQDKNVHKP